MLVAHGEPDAGVLGVQPVEAPVAQPAWWWAILRQASHIGPNSTAAMSSPPALTGLPQAQRTGSTFIADQANACCQADIASINKPYDQHRETLGQRHVRMYRRSAERRTQHLPLLRRDLKSAATVVADEFGHPADSPGRDACLGPHQR